MAKVSGRGLAAHLGRLTAAHRNAWDAAIAETAAAVRTAQMAAQTPTDNTYSGADGADSDTGAKQ